MTREEAIKALTSKTNPMMQYEAFGMAIRSLEAWDEVLEEIENHRRKTKSIDKYDLVGDCLDIIKNYMKEVEA